MHNIREHLYAIVDEARVLHRQEREMTLASIRLLSQLVTMNAAVNLGMSTADFAAHIELTLPQYWKRCQAARVVARFPEALSMLEAGETHVSHLSIIAPVLTAANADLLFQGIKGKAKRDVQELVSRVTCDGRLRPREALLDLRLTLTKSQMAIVERARDVLAHGGRLPSLAEVVVRAAEDLLVKRDPMKKAERAMRRQAKAAKARGAMPSQEEAVRQTSTAPEKEKEMGGDMGKHEAAAPAQDTFGLRKAQGKTMAGQRARPAIPAAIRHQVWWRDQSQCTWQMADGRRCPERAMLELDHRQMWCQGGEHTTENLTLRCRRHNQWAAEIQLGAEVIARARSRGQAACRQDLAASTFYGSFAEN